MTWVGWLLFAAIVGGAAFGAFYVFLLVYFWPADYSWIPGKD